MVVVIDALLMPRSDTVPVTPEHPTTPLEQMEEDDMCWLHPTLPSNAALNAAGDNGILLTDEQHRICQNLLLVSSVVGRHLGCPRCTCDRDSVCED